MDYAKRTTRLILGLCLYGLGSYLNIQANIGLSPWEAFGMGMSNLTSISYGNITVLTGLMIVIIDFILKEKIGFGTIINAILIGKVVDWLMYFDLMPMMSNFWLGLMVLFLGQITICIASYFYIGAMLGCGPRDALMVALGKRFDRVPIGAVRGLLEGTVLLIGWMFGAKVGIGTIISVFGIGFILQMTFKILRFDVKGIKHESMLDTIKTIKHRIKPTENLIE